VSPAVEKPDIAYPKGRRRAIPDAGPCSMRNGHQASWSRPCGDDHYRESPQRPVLLNAEEGTRRIGVKEGQRALRAKHVLGIGDSQRLSSGCRPLLRRARECSCGLVKGRNGLFELIGSEVGGQGNAECRPAPSRQIPAPTYKGFLHFGVIVGPNYSAKPSDDWGQSLNRLGQEGCPLWGPVPSRGQR